MLDNLPIKALSIRQPWAWAILNAGKRVENRPRRFHYRGPICLHASSSFAWSDWDDAVFFMQCRDVVPPLKINHDFGGIVGTAEIVDCIEQSDSPWFFGPYGLVLKNVHPIEFIPVKGALGLFDWRRNL